MKKILIASLAFAAIFTSCVKERETSSFDGKNTITFELPGKKAVTYATPGTTDENSLGGGVVVYMFNGTTCEGLFQSGDADYSLNGSKLTLSIDGSGTRDFYLVANVNNVTLPENPTLAELTNLISNTPALNADKYHAINPVNAGDYILMSASATGISIEEPTSTTVKLVRRMARFDVVKDATAADLDIKNVLISNTNVDGDVFAGATGNVYTVGGIEPVALTFTDDNAAGAFYLYPTQLGDGNTVISFETDKGIYVVTTNKTIEANKLYTITVKQPASSEEPEFDLEAEDWGDGDGIDAEPGSSVAGIVGTPVVGGNAVFSGNILTVDAEKGTTLDIETSSATAAPVVTVSPAAMQSFVTVTSEAATLTYSGAYYSQKHTITVAEGIEEIDATVTFNNNSAEPVVITIKRESAVPEVTYVYPGTTLESVKVGDVIWAPVNVGAWNIRIGTSALEIMGYVYQWGRDKGIIILTPGGTTTSTNIVDGPISYEAATTGTYKESFIRTSSDGWMLDMENAPNHWNNNIGPCPSGWRLPTRAEVQTLIDRWDNVDREGYYAKFKGDNQQRTLWIPVTGFVNKDEGKTVNFNTELRLWTSECDFSTSYQVYYARMFNNGATTANYINLGAGSQAQSVRCVKDAE